MGWSYVQSLVMSNRPNVMKSIQSSTQASWMLQLLRQHSKTEHTIERRLTKLKHARIIPKDRVIEIDGLPVIDQEPMYHVANQLHQYKANEVMRNRYQFQDQSNLRKTLGIY